MKQVSKKKVKAKVKAVDVKAFLNLLSELNKKAPQKDFVHSKVLRNHFGHSIE